MFVILSILVFALAYAIKGGWMGKYTRSGKAVSTAIVLLFGIVFLPWQYALALAAAWVIGVAPSMGEEAGAVGDYKEGWGDYVDHPDSFGREYGVKKSIQRGLWTTFFMGAVLNSWALALCGALFPVVYFIGNSACRYFKRSKGWAWSEWLYGGVIGLVIGFSLI